MSLFVPARILILLAILGAGCPGRDPSESPRVTLLVAASTTDAMAEFARNYESATGVRVDVATGPSNGLARQITAGAPADLFVSASLEWADALATESLVDERATLLINRLVLVVPAGNPRGVRTLADLMDENIEHVALAGENVPAGEYAEAALRHYELFEPLVAAGKVVRGHDVRVTLGYVERGEVAAGIVYATDAMVSERVEVVEQIAPTSHPPIRYPVVLLKQASPAGRDFYEALISGQNAELFSRHGFQMDSPAETDL